ncbi:MULTISPECIES: hypothetical protein [Streptomyces]|uniref:Endoglucanase n=1 Tax=Streptomyces harbinensis TaxID=1176198 RepID=A0A1I6VSB5_9ACTN|nr:MULTISPECIES: hypothetical protein [Streptomyces]SFT16559.1 endoglucanase [Streptomyces harbinensis]
MVRSRSSWLSAALLALAVLLGLAGPAPAATPPPPTGATGASAAETVAAMQPGWNLGNTLDATGPDETSWGNPG